MDKPMSRLDFLLMSFGFKIRDTFRPRIRVLNEVGIQPGSTVLDYGCGPGSYVAPLASLLGPTGRIYALDMNPAAIMATERVIAHRGIQSATTILSDCGTGLPKESVDIVLLYDTLHHLPQPDEILGELHRVLRTGGTLSVSDHHLRETEVVSRVTDSGMFETARAGSRTHSFVKTQTEPQKP